jgi:hypothetical protein
MHVQNGSQRESSEKPLSGAFCRRWSQKNVAPPVPPATPPYNSPPYPRGTHSRWRRAMVAGGGATRWRQTKEVGAAEKGKIRVGWRSTSQGRWVSPAHLDLLLWHHRYRGWRSFMYVLQDAPDGGIRYRVGGGGEVGGCRGARKQTTS